MPSFSAFFPRKGELGEFSFAMGALLSWLLRFDLFDRNLRPLLCIREDDSPVFDFTPARLNGKWPDPMSDHRIPSAVPVQEDLPRLRDLRQENQGFVGPVVAFDPVDEEDASFPINFDLAIAEFGDVHSYRPSPGARRDLVDHFLRESVKDD